MGENISERRLTKTRDYKCNPCNAADALARYHRNKKQPIRQPKPKVCKDCGVDLVLGGNWPEYLARRYRRICHSCNRIAFRAYRIANRERLNAQKRDWMKAHQAEQTKRLRKWRDENREHYREYQREYQRDYQRGIRRRDKVEVISNSTVQP